MVSSLLPLRQNHQRLPPTLPKTSHLWSILRCGECGFSCCRHHPYPGRKRRYSDMKNHNDDDDNNDDDRDIGRAIVSQRKPILFFVRQNKKIQRMILMIVFIGGGCCSVSFRWKLLLTMRSTSTFMNIKQQQQQLLSILKNNNHHHCAINLYGLPRQYYYMTHHSIIQNIILPNLIYNCDYYIHYYNDTIIETTNEQRGADIGHGNTYFDPNEILLLQNDILQLHYDYYYYHQSNNNNNNNNSSSSTTIRKHYQPPIIQYRTTSEHEFHQQYKSLIQTIHEYQHPITQQHLYLPLSEALPFSNTTLINIIKMWHSQQSVFELMDDSTTGTNHHHYPSSSKKHYSRVGMFRNDVLYVTPIDIYQIPSSIDLMDYRNQNQRKKNRRRRTDDDDTSTLLQLSYDIKNQYAVIPNFANYPVNDRMIYGPYDAILIYATYKFRLLHAHIHSNINQQKQYGIHSEQYLYHTILPMIQQYGHITILQRNDICFLRVRTDYSIRINDCSGSSSSITSQTCTTVQQQNNVHTIIEQQILLRSCQLDVTLPHVPFLLCPPMATIDYNNHSTSSTALIQNNNIDSTTIPSQWDFCLLSSTP